MLESIKTCFKKYADFKGRATRSEFWWFQLFFWLVLIGAILLLEISGNPASEGRFDVGLALEFALVVPILSVTSRRLHDIGLTGWIQAPAILTYLEDLGLIIPGFRDVPLVGHLTNAGMVFFVVILIICIKRGSVGTNKYGPDPKSADVGTVFS